MPTMTVRNLPSAVHRRIKLYAAEHGISAEAAARQILDEATRPAIRLGDIVAAHARERQADLPATPRDPSPINPADFA